MFTYKKRMHVHKKTCTRIFIGALFIIAKKENNPDVSQLGKLINHCDTPFL